MWTLAHADQGFVVDTRAEVSALTRVGDRSSESRAVDDLLLATLGIGVVVDYFRVSTSMSIGAAVGRRDGVAYELGLLPLGLAYSFGADSYIALGTGVVLEGATGALDDGVLFPVELASEVGDRNLHLITRLRISYVTGRGDAAPSVAGHTELAALAAFQYRNGDGNGPYLGVSYQEWLGASYAGLVLGVGNSAPGFATAWPVATPFVVH